MALQLSGRLALGAGVTVTYNDSSNKNDCHINGSTGYIDYGLNYTAASPYNNPTSTHWLSSSNSSVMLRVNGIDPQRRKMYNSSFWYAYNGKTELTATGMLFLAPHITSDTAPTQWCSYVICIADIIIPFIDPTQSNNSNTTLLQNTIISVLIHNNTNNTDEWWRCELIDLTDLPDIDECVTTLVQSSSDWKIGWTSQHKPLSLYSNSHTKLLGKNYADVQQPKSSTVCILKVIKPVVAESMNQFDQHISTVPPIHTQPTSHAITNNLSATLQHNHTDSSQQYNHIHMNNTDSTRVLPPYNKYLSAARLANTPDDVIEAEQRVQRLTNHVVPIQTPQQQRRARYNDVTTLNELTRGNQSIWSQYVQPTNIPTYTLSTWASSATLKLGSKIYCIASPYGALSPTVFSNSVSTGIISNMVSVTKRKSQSNQQYSIRDMMTELLIIDARCLPGSQGAPVYDDNGRIVGLVTLPLRHTTSGSAVELNLAITIDVISKYIHTYFSQQLKSIKSNTKAAVHPLMFNSQSSALFASARSVNTHSTSATLSTKTCKSNESIDLPQLMKQPHEQSNDVLYDNQLESDGVIDQLPLPVEHVIDNTSRWVSLVRIGNSWATAICINDTGYYVTNAHLVRPFLSNTDQSNNRRYILNNTLSIKVEPRNIDEYDRSDKLTSLWYNGTVEWICNGSWDIAILKINIKHTLYSAQFPSALQHDILHVGNPVAVIGFPLFAPTSELQPSVCVGVLSKIVRSSINNQFESILLQSDTCVHNGNSGGVLIDLQSGLCIGMVTSNVLHSSLDPSAHYISESNQVTHITIIPRLNFSIPYNALIHCVYAVNRVSHNNKLHDLLIDLDVKQSAVQSVWQLELPYSSDNDPVAMGGAKYRAYIKQMQQQEQIEKQNSDIKQHKTPIPRL